MQQSPTASVLWLSHTYTMCSAYKFICSLLIGLMIFPAKEYLYGESAIGEY